MLNSETERNNLADRLKSAIAQSGIPKTSIALRCGVSDQAVTGWLKTGRISKQHLPTISLLLGVSVEWLLTGKEMLPLALPDQASNEELPASPQEAALLGLFRGLTDKQKTEIVQTLEAQKQQNKIAWEELSKVMGKK